MHQIVCGLIGKTCTGGARERWNRLFTERGVDAFFDFYRTMTREDLELRLSEMFLLERRGYVVGGDWQSAILPLLDAVHETAKQKGSVDTIVNERGVLTGYFFGDSEDVDAERMKVWFG